MVLRMTTQVGDRFDEQVAAVPGGWVSASRRALTRWVDSTPQEPPVVVPEALPGPLAWLSTVRKLAWGPTVLDDDRPRWGVAEVAAIALEDVGAGASRVFDLAVGAVAADARRVFAGFYRRQPRTRNSPTLSDTTRLAIVDPLAGDTIDRVGGQLPTSVLWGDGPLALGYPGRVQVRADGGSWTVCELDGPSAARALCHGPEGSWFVGTASGNVMRFDERGRRAASWRAHEGPVTALTSVAGLLVSGGADGLIRAWSGAACQADLDAGGAVQALTGAGEHRLVGLVGGAGGSLMVLEL